MIDKEKKAQIVRLYTVEKWRINTIAQELFVHHSTVERAGEVFDLIHAGKLEVRIGGRYPLEDAGRAHEDLEARRTSGKLLLLP